jgi:hypothetical protein
MQLLDESHDGQQRLLERRVRGDELEHAALAVGQRVRLAPGAVVEDAGSEQALLRRRQANEAHLAGNLLALPVAVQPFEDGPRAAQRALDVARVQAHRRQPVALELRAQRFGADAQQLLARQLEELDGVVVDLDEDVAVDVEHDDRLGRVLDERAIARLALAQRLLVLKALRDVAHAEHEAHARADAGAADGDLDGQHAAAAALCLDELRFGVDERVRDAIGERFERGPRGRELRQEARDVLADDVRNRRAEQTAGGRIGVLHDAVRSDAQDRIFDVLEDRVQDRGRVLRLRRVVPGEDDFELVAYRRALEGCGNPALEAVLRHGELAGPRRPRITGEF